MLDVNPGLQAKTIFAYLKTQHPGRFQDGQLRTLQRRVKSWRALEGPAKEVFFPQVHYPGALAQSDFTSMNSLGVTIEGAPFPHLVYHFVLTYSNWGSGTVCFSESFESLSVGMQNALWELGGVPVAHQTDRLSAAVNKVDHPEEFTAAYRAVLAHYGLEGHKGQAGKANENGDVEQRHHRFKIAVDQALLLRGSRNFPDRESYETFLGEIFAQLNAGRSNRFSEEIRVLRRLSQHRLDAFKRIAVRVRPGSTIRVQHNVYSVHRRLIGEMVDVRIHPEHLEVRYAQRIVEKLLRLRGTGKHRVDYRHIIEWLVRKPGAFANYRYLSDLFPSSRFRMSYDALKADVGSRADKEYLKILELSAKEGESVVEWVLRLLLEAEQPIAVNVVKDLVRYYANESQELADVDVEEVDLNGYDSLLEGEQEEAA
jgi:hypothetical protein